MFMTHFRGKIFIWVIGRLVKDFTTTMYYYSRGFLLDSFNAFLLENCSKWTKWQNLGHYLHCVTNALEIFSGPANISLARVFRPLAFRGRMHMFADSPKHFRPLYFHPLSSSDPLLSIPSPSCSPGALY